MRQEGTPAGGVVRETGFSGNVAAPGKTAGAACHLVLPIMASARRIAQLLGKAGVKRVPAQMVAVAASEREVNPRWRSAWREAIRFFGR